MKNSIQNIIKTVIIFSLFFTLFSASAQAPQKMSYQAIIRNASNGLVINANIGMRISILQGSSTGASVYTETQTTVTDSNGLVTLQIGGGIVVSGVFDSINWAFGSYFIKTETDPTGGTNYSIVGTNQLLSVPYALSSADNKWGAIGGNISNSNTGNVGIGTNAPVYKLHVGNSSNAMRIEGPQTTGGSALSIGGFGKIEVDAPGLQGGRFNIQENGNVGIGTTAPVAKLDVAGGNWNLTGASAGDFRIGNATQNFKLGVATAGGGAGHATMTATSILSLGTGTTDPNVRTLNIAAGDIGIGTITPQKYGYPTTDKILEIKNQLSSDNSQSHLILSTNGTTGAAGTITWADPSVAFGEKKMASIQGFIDDNSLYGLYNSRLGFSTREYNGQLSEKIGINGNGSLTVNGNIGAKGQILTSNGPNLAASWSSVGTIIKAVQGNSASLNLSGFNAVDLLDAHIGLTNTVPVRIILYYETTTSKPCFAGSCNTKWELQVLKGGVIKTFGINGANYSGDSVPTSASIGPHIVDLQPGQHTFQFKAKNVFNDPQISFRAYAIIIPQ